jgi:putative salt-induced outer membrane protein YdiY
MQSLFLGNCSPVRTPGRLHCRLAPATKTTIFRRTLFVAGVAVRLGCRARMFLREIKQLRTIKMKRHTIAIFVTAGLVAGSHGRAFAQTQPQPPPPPWQSSATLGLSLTRGNSDTVLFTGNVKTQKKGPQDEWAFGADGAYGENNSVKNNESLHGFGQYNRLFNDRWFGYARVDALHDGIADVAYRVALSPGIGYYFIKEKDTSLAAEVGPGVVFEKRGGIEKTYATLRVAERFEHKFSDHARLWQSAEFLPEVKNFGNYLLNVEVGVAAALTKKIELTVMLQDNYASRPAAGRKSNDLKLISGITYKF